MLHLPNASSHEDEGLQDGPPQHPLVGTLTGLPEALLLPLGGENGEGTWLELIHPQGEQLEKPLPGSLHIPCPNWASTTPHPLVLLLLLDLHHLFHQLLHTKMQQGQFVLGCKFRIVSGVFTQLHVQVNGLGTGVKGRGQAAQCHAPARSPVSTCQLGLILAVPFPFPTLIDFGTSLLCMETHKGRDGTACAHKQV